jgi:predicted nucleic acid-binding Zn ribbon protein
MPTYVYKDDDGNTYEVVQSIHEDPWTYVDIDGARKSVKRVPQPAMTILKGSGFARNGG